MQKLLLTAAFVAFAAPAFADGVISRVTGVAAGLNGQINLGNVSATADVITGVTGPVTATAAAIGNSASYDVDAAGIGAIAAGIGQKNFGQIEAGLVSTVEKATGAVSQTAAAIGNSTSLSVGAARGAVIAATGQGNAGDVSAKALVGVNRASAAVDVTSAAIGNSISVVNDTLN